jgi:uncharacterized membrane protein
MSEAADGGTEGDPEEPEMEDLLSELADLQSAVDSPAERAQVRETMELAIRVNRPGVFGRVVRGFDSGDVAEAMLGSVIFGIPMFVEGGTIEIGDFLAAHPVAMVLTVSFTVVLVVGILYVADIQDVRVTDPFFGVIPRRLVGVLGVSLLTAVGLMTLWGRVDWAEPWLASCRVAVAYLPMAVGSALGDLLPEG